MDPINYTSLENPSTLKMVKVMYILNFLTIIFPICSIVAVVFAYIFRDEAKGYLHSHFQYIIRGFWISLLYSAIAAILCLIVIGAVLIVLVAIWWIIRNAIGFKRALHNEAIKNPTTWVF